jgi:cytochrome c oxidase subunit 2
VAKALTDAGMAQERIALHKPTTITAGAGADQQARRVDIVAASERQAVRPETFL